MKVHIYLHTYKNLGRGCQMSQRQPHFRQLLQTQYRSALVIVMYVYAHTRYVYMPI